MKWSGILNRKDLIGGEINALIGQNDYRGLISGISQVGEVVVVVNFFWLAIFECTFDPFWKKFNGLPGAEELPRPFSGLKQISLPISELPSPIVHDGIVIIDLSPCESLKICPKDSLLKLDVGQVVGLSAEEKLSGC